MGNQNCSQIYQHTEQNQAYGDFRLVKQKGKLVALVQKGLQNDTHLIEQVKAKLQNRLQLKSHHLVKLISYLIKSDKYSTHINMFYDFINKTLLDRIDQLAHSKQNNQWSERELFNIIYGVENAILQLDKHEIRHGCINLSTILCQGNFYKITDVSSTTFVKSYDLVRRGCRNQFLSPKLLTNLEYRSLEPYYDIEDDFFSLGMIILTLISKVDVQNFYQWKQKTHTATLRWDRVQQSIKRVERSYSSKLSIKVKQLIKYETESDKSIETSTSINNNPNIMGSDKFIEINDHVNQLDRDIERILSRVNIAHSSQHKSSPFQKVNQKLIHRTINQEQHTVHYFDQGFSNGQNKSFHEKP